MLRIEGLSSYYGRIQALDCVKLEVGAGELVALIGANGAGKSTLLRCISGVQPVSAGCIHFGGRDISRMQPKGRVQAGICQVPEGRQVFGPMSVEDNLTLGAFCRPRDKSVAVDLDAVYTMFPVLYQKRNLAAGTLSGGQQQMLAMGRALMGRPQLLLLDEPSMGLAPLIVREIFEIIGRLRSQGTTILLVEQNAHFALSVADRGYVIETGRITLTGAGHDLIARPEVQAAYLGMQDPAEREHPG
ncbi:ABC transporter ATP-binding protein [Hydrogenophaga sp.]|uniref:ABC transporter ATP-binding protein n=1 Tax=Hydrogenophaga sp. TaxID=1904254 RepID=UPI0027288C46|nr:ABC transporter ATP-binding protein [Hydrogenophaga sp.]MDO8905608.1 ABC transporter ATP-binding protein [Hydrogenophaga sp.]